MNVSVDWLLSEEETSEDYSSSKAYPEWADHLPGFISGLIRRYGWLYGVYLAVGGAFLMGMGIFVRRFSYGFVNGFFDESFRQTSARLKASTKERGTVSPLFLH